MLWRARLAAHCLTILALSTVTVTASTAPTSCRKLRLGGAIALTGKYALNGRACEQGWTLWAERLNARGGFQLSGNQSCLVHLPLDLRDDGSSASTSQEVLKEMLDPTSPTFANLDFVIGPFSSGITKGNAQVAKNAGRVLFSHGASESLYNQGNQYIFSTLTPGGLYMASGLDVLFARGARSVVFAHEEKSFSKSVCAGANMTAHKLGMQVLGYFEYPAGKTNFADIVFDIKKLGADVYVGCGHIDDVTYLVGNANVLNVNPSALLVTHAADTRIVKNIGIPYSHGLLSPTQWDKHLNFKDQDGFFGSAQQFNELFAQRWGSEPAYASAYAAAMGYALQKAIENANSYDTDAVRHALQTLSVDSFYGPIKFSSLGDPSGLVGTMPGREMVTTQIFNGSVEVVAPEAAASNKVLYPLPSWSERQVMLYPCNLGYFEEGTDVHGNAVCAPCPRGQYRDKFSAMCVLCQPGQIASEPGASSCKPCPAATHSEAQFGSAACVTCPDGAFCSEGQWEPAACPLGHYCVAGQVLPTPCPDGTYRDVVGGTDELSCLDCQPGRYSNRAGMDKCLPCAAGWQMPMKGQRECQECPVSTYQASQGETNCTACPPTFVTHFSGAESATACVCKSTFFLNRVTGRCEACPVGAVCSGGSAVPYIKEGFYAELKGDPNRSIGDPEAFFGLLVWACPQPARSYCPGSYLPNPSDRGDDFISAVHLPNECPPNHHGITCAWCNDGRFFDGSRCVECGAYSSMGTTIAILLCALMIAAGLYKFTGLPVPKSFVGMMLLSNVAGLVIFYVQILSLLHPLIPAQDSFSTETRTSAVSRMFLLDLPFYHPDCLLTNSFPTAYGSRVAIPLLIIAAFFVNWLLSVSLHVITGGRVPKMSFDHSVNVCGLVLQALYIGLCKVGLSYYLCRSHASGPDTLVAYPAVICGSDEHRDLLPVGILTIVFYMVGIFAIMLYCCIVAPERYLVDARFRDRVRFLVQKWRPDKWYWGMVYMLRNVAITLVQIVVPQDTTLQCSFMLIVLSLSMTTLALNRPWRDDRGNYTDLATTLLLCCLCIFCFLFSPVEAGPSPAAWLEIVIKVVFGSVGVVIMLGIGYALALMSNQTESSQGFKATVDSIAEDLTSLGQKLAECDADRLIESFLQLTQVDLADIQRTLQMFTECAEFDAKLPSFRKSSKKSLTKKASFLRSYSAVTVGDSVGSVLCEAYRKTQIQKSEETGALDQEDQLLCMSDDSASFRTFSPCDSNAESVKNQIAEEMVPRSLPRLLCRPTPASPFEKAFEKSNAAFEKGEAMKSYENPGFSRETTASSKSVPILSLRPSPQCFGDRGPVPADILLQDVWAPIVSGVTPTCMGFTTL